MAASVNRPTAYSRPAGGIPGSHSSGLMSSVPPDLGPHSSGPEPGFSSNLHPPVFVPPAIYPHAPPPPPFLHYPWPTPFSFTPFAGYPGRSFGMVVPPYLEPPSYILPHPHIQPVDYRRLLHPHVPAQYPNQTRRTHLPYVPPRETVNSEVQTENNTGTYRVGWPPDISDSGRGTGSNASHSPGSSSPKQDPAEGLSYDNGNCVQLSFTGLYIGSGAGEGTDGTEEVAHAKDGDAIFKVLRLPHADTELCLESWETVEPVELPFCERPSLNSRQNLQCSINSCMFLDGEPENSDGTNLISDFPDNAPYKMSLSNSPMKQKLNESVWSVESLEPYIPSREWLLENSSLQTEINKPVEEPRKDGLSAQNDDQIVKADNERRQSWRQISMSVQMSGDGLDINVQDEQQSPPNQMEVEKDKTDENQSSVHSELDSLSLPILMSSEAVCPSTENKNDERSSEPEATQSPNQEPLIRNELQEKSNYSEKKILLDSLAEISFPGQVISHTEVNGAPVTRQKIPRVLPSKRHLMDFGVQCSKGQEPKCFCGLLSYRPNKTHNLNIQMSGTIKLKLSESIGMCRKGLADGGRILDDHTNQQEAHSGCE